MTDYIKLSINLTHIFINEAEQAIYIKRNLTTNQLVAQIMQELDPTNELNPENYTLQLEPNDPAKKPRRLKLNRSLAHQGVETDAKLSLIHVNRIKKRASLNFSPDIEIGLRYVRKNVRSPTPNRLDFIIKWTPTHIGRPDSNYTIHNHLMGVDLSGHPQKSDVSRLHAHIEYQDDNRSFWLVARVKHNKTLLNDKKLLVDHPVRLKNGDIIQLANNIKLEFVRQKRKKQA